jgi:hypothetical protein
LRVKARGESRAACVPDAADDARICQRPLQGAVFPDQRGAEAFRIGGKNVNAARVHGEQAGLSCHHVERCPPPGAGLGERERARREIESRQILPALENGVNRLPMQPAGDHQVQHQPEVAFQADRDALSHPPQLPHSSSLGFRKPRRRGAKKKRAGQPDAFERPPHHARVQRHDIGRDVRQLGHASPACISPAAEATPVENGRRNPAKTHFRGLAT